MTEMHCKGLFGLWSQNGLQMTVSLEHLNKPSSQMGTLVHCPEQINYKLIVTWFYVCCKNTWTQIGMSSSQATRDAMRIPGGYIQIGRRNRNRDRIQRPDRVVRTRANRRRGNNRRGNNRRTPLVGFYE